MVAERESGVAKPSEMVSKRSRGLVTLHLENLFVMARTVELQFIGQMSYKKPAHSPTLSTG
jgi:hypothetical protein